MLPDTISEVENEINPTGDKGLTIGEMLYESFKMMILPSFRRAVWHAEAVGRTGVEPTAAGNRVV